LRAVSNTSTLIRFYRARSFLEAFRSYYNEGILIPSFCWAELERPPLRPENELMREDLTAGFIILVELTRAETAADFRQIVEKVRRIARMR